MTQIIVPTDTPGVNIVRGIGVWGRETSDHCEIDLRERARAGRQQARARRRGPPGRAGPPRRRAHLPLHELGRPDVARVRPDGRARADARGARRAARRQAVHPGLHRRLLHRHPGGAADDDPRRREDRPRRPGRAHRHLGDQGLRARGLPPRRRPRDPGVGRGRRVERPAARRHVPGRPHAAHRRRPRRGAQDPHREERARRYEPARAGTSGTSSLARMSGRGPTPVDRSLRTGADAVTPHPYDR